MWYAWFNSLEDSRLFPVVVVFLSLLINSLLNYLLLKVFRIKPQWSKVIGLSCLSFLLSGFWIVFAMSSPLLIRVPLIENILNKISTLVFPGFIFPFFGWLIACLIVRRYLATRWASSIILSFFSMLFSIVVFFCVVFSLFMLSEHCDSKNIFHEFNAHLKDVCWRDNKSECPKTESDLASFENRKYAEFKSCYKTKYWFDPNTGKYAWVVKSYGGNHVLVAHPDFKEGFAMFWIMNYFKSSDQNQQWWPPKIDGPWENLLP